MIKEASIMQFSQVENLIANQHYEDALRVIEEQQNNSTSMRRLINQKAQCLIGLSRLKEAEELFSAYCPFLVRDIVGIESVKILSQIKKEINLIESERYHYCYTIMSHNEDPLILARTQQYKEKERHLVEERIYDQHTYSTLLECLELSYELNQMVEAALFAAVILFNHSTLPDDLKELLENNEALWRLISTFLDSSERHLYIVSTKETRYTHVQAMKLCASLLFKKVFIIQESKDSETRTYESVIEYISPKELSKIICKQAKVDQTEKIIIGDNCTLKAANDVNGTYKYLEVCYRNIEEVDDYHLDCFYLGDYASYYATKYREDLEELLHKPSEVDFSIIVPVRNKATYLCEVLATCLEQDYQGEYEILVSDNSDADNTEVLECIRSIADGRIRYIHTPCVMPLAKSFEYAYLHARGDYLISLGADDGMIRNALTILKKIVNSLPDYNIYQCNRFEYYWDGFQDSSISNKIYYTYFTPHDQLVSIRHTSELREKIITREIPEIEFPYMYMQTIKRSYLQRLYEVTGKIGFGISQDIYNGVLNSFLEDKIVYINLPLIVAGKTPTGTGFSTLIKKDMRQFCKQYISARNRYQFENYYNSEYRKFMNFFIPYGTYALTYSEFLKICSFDVGAEEYLTVGNTKKVIHKIFNRLPPILDDENLILSQIQTISHKFGLCNTIWYKLEILKYRLSKVPTWRKLQTLFHSAIKRFDPAYYRMKGKVIDCQRIGIHGIFEVTGYLTTMTKSDWQKYYPRCRRNRII